MASTDEIWMQTAVQAAHEAVLRGEVPIGAVVIDPDGRVAGIASNRTIADSDPTAHAEILAIRAAASKVGNYRLTGMTVYSTIEPCVMCAGALVNARVARLVYGSADARFGAVRSIFRLCDDPALNHRIEITSGVLEEDCRKLMQEFFRVRRRPQSDRGIDGEIPSSP